MNKKKIKLIISLIIVIFLAILILSQLGVFSGKKIDAGNTSVKADVAAKGKLAKVKVYDVDSVYKAIGTVHSRNDVEISSRLTARVVKVMCRSGDHVKKGEELATLENNELSAAVAKTKMNIRAIDARISVEKESIIAAQAEVKRAKSSYDRYKTLSRTKAVSDQMFETSEKQMTQANVSLKQAELNLSRAYADRQAAISALEEAKTMLSYSKIISPMDGVISEEFVDPGDIALPGKILFKVFEPEALILEIPVRESLIKDIKVGDKISFYVSALKKNYVGEIREIVPFVDYNTRTFVVKVCIGSDKNLVPGMYGEASIMLGKKKELLVPESAIIRVGQLETVQLWENGKFKKVFIETTESNVNGFRRVLSGIKAGDSVALDNNK